MEESQEWPATKPVPTSLVWDLAMARIASGTGLTLAEALKKAVVELMNINAPIVVRRDVTQKRAPAYPHDPYEVGVEYLLEGVLTDSQMTVRRRKVG